MLNALVLDKETIKIENVLMFNKYPSVNKQLEQFSIKNTKDKTEWTKDEMIGKRTTNDPTEGQF